MKSIPYTKAADIMLSHYATTFLQMFVLLVPFEITE